VPEFDKTGISCKSFNILFSAIRFSYQPEQQGVQSSVRHCWALIDYFVSAFNTHRRIMVTTSEDICVDESMSRWNGQGGHWTDIRLPHYVAVDRKPENGCEIVGSCAAEATA
jgi:hypothetical protein